MKYWIFVPLLSVIALEGILRLQQWVPIYDLNPTALTATLSETRNHKPSVGLIEQNWQGLKFKKQYDGNGVRINSLRPSNYQNSPKKKLLFLGDSFMEGFQDALTLPQMIWERSGRIREHWDFLNAGHSSYSPSIYAVQIVELNRLKPDFIVIAIDETDLGDDFLRYKRLTERGKDGKIVAVRSTPETKVFLEGLENLNLNPSYIGRLFQKIYHTKIRMQKVNSEEFPKSLEQILQYSRLSVSEAWIKEPEALEYFERVVRELIEKATRVVGEKKNILLVKHPHLGNLRGEQSNLIASIVRKQCEQLGVDFLDLKAHFLAANRPPEAFYFENDIHFNEAGFQRYANGVSEALFPKILETLRPSPGA